MIFFKLELQDSEKHDNPFYRGKKRKTALYPDFLKHFGYSKITFLNARPSYDTGKNHASGFLSVKYQDVVVPLI